MGFTHYIQLGLEHIADLEGYDHILFIVTMCAVYRPQDWRKLLLLVTAFTVGHSLTLALAALEVVSVPSDFVEFLIPVTILMTALLNLLATQKPKETSIQIPFLPKDSPSLLPNKLPFWWNYAVILFFGLIHGLGFSNFFKMLLGQNDSIVTPLLAFNIGVEIGQIGIVLVFMLITYLLLTFLKVRHRDWIIFVSGAAFGVSLVLIQQSDFLSH